MEKRMTEWTTGNTCQGGAQDAQPTRPPYSFEAAAHAWTSARERKNQAEAAFAAAESELAEARRNEIAAWNELEKEAGRGPQSAPAQMIQPRVIR